MIDLISEVRSVRAEMNVPAGALVPLVLVAGEGHDLAPVLARWGATMKRLARLADITPAAEPPPRSVQVLVRGSLVALVLDGVIDFAAETLRLAKEIAKLDGEAAKITAKLGNEDFRRRAPEEIVEEQRERLADVQERSGKLATALSRLQTF